MSRAAYDEIGIGYTAIRRPDPRIAGAIERALGDAETVLNIGAGAGSYEPTGRQVTAVEPSALMIEQRAPDAAPVVQGVAEDLPFDDDSFDASMAVLTVHHWQNLAAGIAEARRVSRHRVVVVTIDLAVLPALWLVRDYFPEALHEHADRMPSIGQLAALLPEASTEPLPIPRGCSDRFFAALWDQPEACLDPDVRRASSVWHDLPPAATERGLRMLAEDLRSGRWEERNRHLAQLKEFDAGLRLVISGSPS